MQAEEIKADTPEEALLDNAETPTRHHHVVTYHKELEKIHVIAVEPLDEFVGYLHRILRTAYRASVRETGLLAEEFPEQPDRAGRGFMRLTNLSDLEDAFDPTLFEHQLFKGELALDCLEEAYAQVIGERLGEVQTTEDVRFSVYVCDKDLAECKEREKSHPKENHVCPGCGKDHPSFGEMVAQRRSGGPWGAWSHADPATTEAYLNADRSAFTFEKSAATDLRAHDAEQ